MAYNDNANIAAMSNGQITESDYSGGNASIWSTWESWNDQRVEAAVFSRADMRAGHTIMGPAIVEQQDTTTWLSPQWSGQVLKSGSLRLQPAPQDKDG